MTQNAHHLREMPQLMLRTLVQVDAVMEGLAKTLGIPVPPYERKDAILVSHEIRSEMQGGGAIRHRLRIILQSVHGEGCPLPWLTCECALEAELPRTLSELAVCARPCHVSACKVHIPQLHGQPAQVMSAQGHARETRTGASVRKQRRLWERASCYMVASEDARTRVLCIPGVVRVVRR